MQRDNAIDLARGLAILTMVWATLSPFTLLAPHPLWFRFLGSFAAPVFVFLAGMMIPFAASHGGHSWRHYLKRAAEIIGLAMLIDAVLWRQWPWFSFDVLYLIGVATPLTFLLSRWPAWSRVTFAVAVMAASPWLREYLGYPEPLRQPRLSSGLESVGAAATDLHAHVLVGGYFPLFPWLGLMVLGSAAGSWRSGSPAPRWATSPAAAWASLGLLALGAVGWSLDPGAMAIRDGFTELFYPATTGYLLLALGVIACTLMACEHLRDAALTGPIRLLGRASLMIYVLHVTLIAGVIRRATEPQSLAFHVAIYAALMATLYAAAWLYLRLKSALRRRLSRTSAWPAPPQPHQPAAPSHPFPARPQSGQSRPAPDRRGAPTEHE